MKIPRLFNKPVLRRARQMLTLQAGVFRNPLPGFDPHYYVYWYRDVLAYPSGPGDHYLHFGWREDRDPSAGFSTSGYLRANPDIVQANVNPLIHFLEFGLAEGRAGWQKDPDLPPPRPTNVQQPMKLLAPPRVG